MKDIEILKEHLNTPKRVVITMHARPDADALGSALGLAAFLKKKGHQVTVIAPTEYPAFLAWMIGSEEVIIFGQDTRHTAEEKINQAELIFFVDFSMLQRIGDLAPLMKNAPAIKITVDHHLEPEHFADLLFWTTKAAATAELLYDIFVALGDEDLIDVPIANCLYAGILTDTGMFKHPNTTAKVHQTVAKLMEAGAETSKVNRWIYDNNSLNRLKFISFALKHRLVVMEAYHAAYFAISRADFKRFNLQTGDTEGLINDALSIKGIVFAAFLTEKPNAVHISLRSVGDIPVNTLAQTYFSGGGHKNAAGGISNLSLAATITKLEALVKENKELFVTSK